MAVALLFATILSFKVKGSKFFRGALYFPCLICGISVGFIFKFFFTRGFVLDSLLGGLGVNMESLPYWLKDESINNIVLVACSVWKYVGQNIVMFIGAIASVDTSLYEAAVLDGASKAQQARYITLPSLQPIIIMMFILAVGRIFSSDFGLFYQVTRGANVKIAEVVTTFDVKIYQMVSTSSRLGQNAAASMFQSIVGCITILTANAIVSKIDRNSALI